MARQSVKDTLKAAPIVEGCEIQIEAEALAKVRNRISRAQGQLNGVLRMIDEGETCQQILTQILAAGKAIDRAAFSMMLEGFDACRGNTEEHQEARETLEKLFMSLA